MVGDENVAERTQTYIGAGQVRGDADTAVNYISSLIDDNHGRTGTRVFVGRGPPAVPSRTRRVFGRAGWACELAQRPDRHTAAISSANSRRELRGIRSRVEAA